MIKWWHVTAGLGCLATFAPFEVAPLIGLLAGLVTLAPATVHRWRVRKASPEYGGRHRGDGGRHRVPERRNTALMSARIGLALSVACLAAGVVSAGMHGATLH